MTASAKILILDDDEAHAENVRQMLLGITPEQWRAFNDSEFHLTPEDIKVATSSAPYVKRWTQEERADLAIVIVDVHMGPGEGEGAREVLNALSRVGAPPFLIVMTQFASGVHDEVTRAIEAAAEDPRSRVPCIVTAKHKEMPLVHDRDRQLERAEWRGLVIKAIAGRNSRDTLKRVRLESRYWRELQGLPALKRAFKEGETTETSPVVVMVTEPDGLQYVIAKASNNEVGWLEPKLRRESFSDLLVRPDSPWSLRNRGRYQAVAVANAEEVLEAADAPTGAELRESLQLLQQGQLFDRTPEHGGFHPFSGKLILCVGEEFDRRRQEDSTISTSLYRSFPRIHVPSFQDIRRRMIEDGRGISDARRDFYSLVDFMVKTGGGPRLSEFDRLVMGAYDWSLSASGGRSGMQALAQCVDRLSRAAERGAAPPGEVVNWLTETAEGRLSVIEGLEWEPLLLFILERVNQSHRDQATLQGAALMFARELCRGGYCELREDFLSRFWKTNGIFTKLAGMNEYASRMLVGQWPNLEDEVLYGATWNTLSTPQTTASEAMLNWLRDETEELRQAPPTEIWTRIAMLWKQAGTGRRKGSEKVRLRPLEALGAPFGATE